MVACTTKIALNHGLNDFRAVLEILFLEFYYSEIGIIRTTLNCK
mgnify:CR=1 FL=1